MTDLITRIALELYECEKERANHCDAVLGITTDFEPFEANADTTWKPDAARIARMVVEEVVSSRNLRNGIWKWLLNEALNAANTTMLTLHVAALERHIAAAIRALVPEDGE